MLVTIMRGLPRSGKSTWVERLLQHNDDKNVVVCSADHFHLDSQGVYRFDPKRAGLAHDYCYAKFLDAIDDREHKKIDAVIVDNTNICGWELAPYFRYAQIKEVPVKIVRCHADFGTILKRTNDHNVPTAVLWSMWQNLHQERLPAWWTEEIVYTGE